MARPPGAVAIAQPPSREDRLIDPEVKSFFRAIKENPDDDTPRLIFADWLQEHGDAAASARGEFLRLNVLRHRLSPDDPRYDLLKRREAEIVRQHQWTWLGPLPDAARWSYERGMIRLIARSAKMLTPQITAWTRTEAALWIDSLALLDMVEGRVARVEQLLHALEPLFLQLNRLDLRGNHLRNHFLAVAGLQELPFLTELLLARNRLTAEHLASLVECPLVGRLTVLNLRYNWLNDDAARILSDSLALQQLTRLYMGGNRFTPVGRALLLDAFGQRVRF